MYKAIAIQKSFGELLDLKLICIMALIVFFMTGSAYAHEDEKVPSRYLTITSHPFNHLVGEPVTISGEYVNATNHFIEEMITIKIFDMDGNKVDEKDSKTVYSKNGRFQVKGFAFSESGTFLAVAESESGALGQYEIHVIDFHRTLAFYIAIVAGAAFVTLMLIMAFIGNKKITISYYRVSRFSLITIIVLCMLSFFIFSNVEYGAISAIGIILKEPTTFEDTNDNIALGLINPLKLGWVLHFGGYSVDDGDKNIGLSIPLYILIFGVLGGYLRFFYFTSRPWLRREMLKRLDDTKEKLYLVDEEGNPVEPDSDATKERKLTKIEKYSIIIKNAYNGTFHSTLSMVLTNRIMSDLSLLLIAPVLAVMMFFVLSQSGLDQSEHVLTFAVSSFIAGLFTEDVIKKVKSGYEKDTEPEPSPDDNSGDDSERSVDKSSRNQKK